MAFFLGLLALCMLRAARADGAASTTCLANTYVEKFSSSLGTTYELTSECKALYTCPAGYYCPAGAYEVTSNGTLDEVTAYFEAVWPDTEGRGSVLAGFSASTFGYQIMCLPAFYCAENTALPRYCPKDYYCRETRKAAKCRSGHYCKEGSVSGRKCGVLARCAKGANKPAGQASSVVLFVLLALLAYCCFRLYADIHGNKMSKGNAELEDYLDELAANQTTADPTTTTGDDVGVPSADEAADKDDVAFDVESKEAPQEEFLIEFTDIRLTLPSGVTIMRGVSGEFAPGTTTAIMGASGAGKTTVMNLVTGKVAKTGGVIRINGEECESLARWKSRVAFVPQEDTMHRHLTVLQNITFSARLRLPTTWSEAKKRRLVMQTLVTLNLQKVQHSIIGDEYQRGISGGQRKRVNVALELVADPKVLFLDEPTSGLDSVSATELCGMLRRIAEQDRMTIAAVIHSPGPAAFAAFHRFLLLQTGGRPVYMGPMDEVQAYFAKIGFTYTPGRVDPLADYMLSAVSGAMPPAADAELSLDGPWEHLTGFHRLWHLQMGLPPPHDDDEKDDTEGLRSSGARRFFLALRVVAHQYCYDYPRDVKEAFFPKNIDPLRPVTGPVAQFKLCCGRAFQQQYSTFFSFLIGVLFVQFMIGVFCAALTGKNLNVLGGYSADICGQQYPQLKGHCLDLQSNSYVSGLTNVGFIIVAAAAAVAASTFGAEVPIYWREAAAALHTPSYYVAKVVADIPMCFCSGMMAWAGFASSFESPMKPGQLFAGFLLLEIFGYLSGYLLSFLLPYSVCGLAGVGWAVFWALLYSGTSARLASDYRDSRWVWALSLPRWVNEGWFYASTVRPYVKVRYSGGPLNGDSLFDFGRQKRLYLFFLNFNQAFWYGLLVCAVLFLLNLIIITSTKLDKKK